MEERAWFEQVYRQNVDLLFRVGRRLLDSDENPDTLYDMVQEIFLLLWDRRETLKTHPNIGGWLMAALKFRILGERGRVTRRALRHAYSLDDDGAAPVSDRALSPEERAVFAGHIQAIRRLLKPDMAELFIDYAVNGCTPQQLAQKNGLTEYIARLAAARRGSRALCHGAYRTVLLTNRQYIFERAAEGERVLVAVNAEGEPFDAHFDAGAGRAVDLVTGRPHDFGGGSRLAPYSAAYWRVE